MSARRGATSARRYMDYLGSGGGRTPWSYWLAFFGIVGVSGVLGLLVGGIARASLEDSFVYGALTGITVVTTGTLLTAAWVVAANLCRAAIERLWRRP